MSDYKQCLYKQIYNKMTPKKWSFYGIITGYNISCEVPNPMYMKIFPKKFMKQGLQSLAKDLFLKML